MEEQERQQLRDRLVAMEARLQQEAVAAIDRLVSKIQSPDEISRIPTHPADLDSDGLDREIALEGNREHLLSEIERAISRVDDGTYGRCEDCGQDIPRARLQALPFATRCVPCQERHERESGVP